MYSLTKHVKFRQDTDLDNLQRCQKLQTFYQEVPVTNSVQTRTNLQMLSAIEYKINFNATVCVYM